MHIRVVKVVWALLLALAPRVAAADQAHDIVVEIPGERSSANLALLGGLTGGALLFGGLAVYFHLDSQSISSELSASMPTGKPWSPALQKKDQQASDDRTRAAVLYSIGGAMLIGAVVTYIATEPDSETQVIHPHTAVQPTQGGALVSHWWSF